ncbi:MAG: hypothetical protein GYB36_07950 [Alphaproteobacteria bacterium]|nr:hypothetical protein [Alphaproteobacteria bacterium]
MNNMMRVRYEVSASLTGLICVLYDAHKQSCRGKTTDHAIHELLGVSLESSMQIVDEHFPSVSQLFAGRAAKLHLMSDQLVQSEKTGLKPQDHMRLRLIRNLEQFNFELEDALRSAETKMSAD